VGRGVVTRPPPFFGLATSNQALMTSDFATLSAGT
jgi:hypothetical protein